MRIRSLLLAAPLIPCLIARTSGAQPIRPAPLSSDVTLTVVVTGATTEGGTIGVALYSTADGFPGQITKAATSSVHPRTAPVDSFVFRGLEPGQYAVSVYHDLNGNGKLDTNLFGVPKEPWGTSANVRPRMRAPRFEEGTLNVSGPTRVEIRVER